MLRGFRFPFLNDEQGGATVLGLSWILLLVGVYGLAVNLTDGVRNPAMLEATADAAALAAVIDLPDKSVAIASAVAYSRGNIPVEQYGEVLKPEDVAIGSWDRALRSFSAGDAAPDAVRVRLNRSEADVDMAPVSFLRRIGLKIWDAPVEAVAQRYIPKCVQNGLVARGIIDISSSNEFVGRICIHAQKGVHMQEINYFEPGVRLSMPEIDRLMVVAIGGVAANSGLEFALKKQSLDPRMVDHVADFITDLLAMKTYVTPAYIDTSKGVIVKDETYDFADLQPGRIYHIQCGTDKTLSIPDNVTLTGVAIISDCQVSVGRGLSMSDVVLASRAGGNPSYAVQNANISFSSDVDLGTVDKCQPGGGVQIFSSASVHFSSSTRLNGVQIVARGDVDLGARSAGINGINVQTGGNITLTSSNMFGSCSGGSPQFFPIFYYRLVA